MTPEQELDEWIEQDKAEITRLKQELAEAKAALSTISDLNPNDAAELERLRETVEDQQIEIVEKDQEIDALKAQLSEAMNVIEFYGDKDNWLCGEEQYTDIGEDDGDKARAFLDSLKTKNCKIKGDYNVSR